MSATLDASGRRRRSWIKALPIVTLGVAAALALFLARDLLSFETLQQNRGALLAWRDQNMVLAALAFAGLYALVVALSIPGAVWMTIAGGFLFGVTVGATLAVIAATLGALAVFLAARSGLGEPLKARAGPWLGRLRAGFEADAASYLLMMRLVPAVPFFVANLAPAFLGARLRTFVWTTFLGVIPGTLVFAWIGAGLGDTLDQESRPDLGMIFEPRILGPLLGLAALSALPILLKRLRPKAARALTEVEGARQ